MLADARSGAAWLNMLKPHRPEPSATLLERILNQTSGITNKVNEPIVLGSTDHLRTPNTLLDSPSWTPALNPATATPARVLPFRQRFANAFRLDTIRHTLMQPRLAMTAAMAFFSIALTLNITGVRLSQLRASDFKPSSIKRTFYGTTASVMRTFDNMRVVYELESRVRDIQRASDSETPASETPAPAPSNQSKPAPSNQPSGDQQSPSQKPKNDPDNPDHKQASPRPKSGTSRRENPEGRLQYVGELSGRGIPPAAMNDFVLFAPNVYKQQQGGLA